MKNIVANLLPPLHVDLSVFMILYSVLSTLEWKACRCTCCRTRPWRGSYCGGMTLTQVGDFSCLTSCLRCNLKVKLQEYSQWWFEVVSCSPLLSEAAVSVLLFALKLAQTSWTHRLSPISQSFLASFFSFWQTALTSIKYLRIRRVSLRNSWMPDTVYV